MNDDDRGALIKWMARTGAKALVFVLLLELLRRLFAMLWTIFCNVDFNVILRP